MHNSDAESERLLLRRGKIALIFLLTLQQAHADSPNLAITCTRNVDRKMI